MHILKISYNELSSLQDLIDSSLEDGQAKLLGRRWNKVKVLVAQLCPTLCDSVVRNPPGSSVQRIFQAKILEWVAVPFSRGSSQLRDQTLVTCTAGGFFTIWAVKDDMYVLNVISGKWELSSNPHWEAPQPATQESNPSLCSSAEWLLQRPEKPWVLVLNPFLPCAAPRKVL